MPTKPKIPPALHALVLKLSGDGRTGEEIADVLWREHHVEAGARAVQRLLEKFAEERSTATQAVLKQELAPHIRPAVRRLKRSIRDAEQIKREAMARARDLRTGPNGHPHHPLADQEDVIALKAIDRIVKCVDRFFHYSTPNHGDKATTPGKVTDAREALLQRIKVLAGVADPKTEPQVH